MNTVKPHHRTGATAVELAITLSVLFLILFGAYELGRANMIMHTCEAAAYEGARVGIIPGATVDDVEDTVRSVLATVAVRNARIETIPNDLSTESEWIAVTVEVNFADNSIVAPMFMSSEPFERRCQMTRESF